LLKCNFNLEIMSLPREAFAAWLPPGGVPFSYAVAVAYVLVDTRDKGIKAFKQSGEELGDPEQYTDQDINIGR